MLDSELAFAKLLADYYTKFPEVKAKLEAALSESSVMGILSTFYWNGFHDGYLDGEVAKARGERISKLCDSAQSTLANGR